MTNLVEVKDNQIVTTSRQVAEAFGKLHKDVLEAIRGILSAENSANKFFCESFYMYRGRKLVEYYMNRDGFSLLAMGFPGKKALKWKMAYIEAFNQMEEALQQKMATPAPVLQKYTYEGTILMPAMHLMTMTKVANSTFLLIAKRFQLPYVSLQGEKLAAFKQENHLVHSSASRMILYPQKTVIGLLNYQRLYDKYKEAVRQYFKPDQEEREWQIEDREKICCWTPQLERSVQDMHNGLIALDGVLKNFGDYRRSVEDHTRYWDTCYELYTKLSTPLQELKKATPFINK